MFIWKIRFEDLTVLEISIANEVFRDSQIILIYLTFSINTQPRKHSTSIFNSLIMDKCYFLGLMLTSFLKQIPSNNSKLFLSVPMAC